MECYKRPAYIKVVMTASDRLDRPSQTWYTCQVATASTWQDSLDTRCHCGRNGPQLNIMWHSLTLIVLGSMVNFCTGHYSVYVLIWFVRKIWYSALTDRIIYKVIFSSIFLLSAWQLPSPSLIMSQQWKDISFPQKIFSPYSNPSFE